MRLNEINCDNIAINSLKAPAKSSINSHLLSIDP